MSNDYAVQRRIKQQKLRRKARRGEIAIRRIYKLVRFAFILFIFYATYRLAICHYWLLPNNIYDNGVGKHIEILGNEIVSDKKILNEMKKFPIEKKPIYQINPAEIANGIEQLSPVKRAYVRRFWFPARYVVMVEEVTPAITISPSEEAPAVAALAITGELIGREYLPLSDKFKAVKVLTYGTNNDDYEKWDVEKINNLYKLAKLLEEYSGEEVEYIDLRIKHNAFAQLESAKLKLGEIDVSVFERIKSIHDILPQIKQMSEKIQYIDLSWKDSKYLKME